MRRCRHRWEETDRFDVRPQPNAEFEGRGPEVLQLVRDATFGYTVVRLKCAECGDVGSRKLEGTRSA